VKAFRHLCSVATLAAIFLTGCGAPHGQPRSDSEVLAPERGLGFWSSLLAELRRLSRCGREGRAAISLANPVYLGYRG